MMKRRSFLGSAAGALGGLTILTNASAAPEQNLSGLKGAFKDVPLRFSMPPGWFDTPKGLSREDKLRAQLTQIADLGVPGYEDLNPGMDPSVRKQIGDECGVQLSCIGGAGRIAPGQMVLPADHDKVEQQFRDRVAMAKTLGVKVLVGLSGNTRDDATAEEQTEAMVACLKRLAPIAEENNVTIVMEALNVLVDHGGYFLTRTDQTMALLDKVDSPNVKMLYDVYHQQITEGNLIRNFTENMDRIAHFHIGDNPGRQEPGTGEINYSNVFKAIYEEGYAKGRYDGFVTFECGNSGDTERALKRILACVEWA